MDRPRKRYLLDGYSLAPDEQLLSRLGQPIHLPKRPFQVLLYLVENRDRFVSRTELLDCFWDGKDVYDDALRKCIGSIRKALDEHSDTPRFIETRWGVGYRYIGPFREQIVPHETSITETERTRGVKIVYEEEEVHDGAAGPSSRALTLHQLAQRPYGKVAILSVILVAITAAAIGFMTMRRSNTEAVRPAIRSVAVLPLRNLTGNPANDYLSDGITDSLITTLSKVGELRVISRGSVFSLKDKNLDPKEAGRMLDAGALVEGSLSQSRDKLRVNVRLVSTTDGQVLWASDSNERAVADIFAIQDEIARNVANGLRIKLSPENGQRLAKRYTDSADAYQAYLEARYFLNQRTREGITKARDSFQQAIEIDPNYALACAGLAESYDKSYFFLELPPQEIIAKEKAAASRALELDGSLPEAHIAMATVYANTWDLKQAAQEEERAIELDPVNVEAHHNYAYRLIDLCRPDEAIAEIKRARELDPLNIVMNIDVGEILFFARRHDEAIVALQRALEMDPNRANVYWNLARIYEEKGMYGEALAAHVKEFTLKGESAQTVAELEAAFKADGMRGFWRKRIQQLRSRGGYTEPMVLADLYACLGDKDQAFAWLEKAYRDHNPYMVGLKASTRVDILRSDPRYDDLLQRVGL